MSSTNDRAHIPAALNAPCLTMSASVPTVGNQATIFVGIIQPEYTNALWDEHATAIRQLFQITDDTSVVELRLASIGNQVDSAQLNRDILNAINKVNQAQVKLLRIVGLGIGSSPSVSGALESLIRCWNINPAEREVLFIALGESEDYHYLNFCKGLCLSQLVKCIHYYNTMDYNGFGFLQLMYSRKLAARCR